MKILVAEDDPIFRRALQAMIEGWGYKARGAATGLEAWDILQADPAVRLAVLDWNMPGMDGLELCQRVRARDGTKPTYLILLSARSTTEDLVAGLEGGADDYLIKPVDFPELHARIRVGKRIIDLQERLADHVLNLEEALEQVKRLQKETEQGRERERFLAMHDALTGLPNRALFFDHLHWSLAQAPSGPGQSRRPFPRSGRIQVRQRYTGPRRGRCRTAVRGPAAEPGLASQ